MRSSRGETLPLSAARLEVSTRSISHEECTLPRVAVHRDGLPVVEDGEAHGQVQWKDQCEMTVRFQMGGVALVSRQVNTHGGTDTRTWQVFSRMNASVQGESVLVGPKDPPAFQGVA
jgi:hypothetical protein